MRRDGWKQRSALVRPWASAASWNLFHHREVRHSIGDPLGGLDLGGTGDPTVGTDPGFLDATIEAIVSLVQAAFQAILRVLAQIIAFVNVFAQLIARAFITVGQFFSHLWNSFFKGIFTTVFNGVRSAQQWLEQRLRPLIKFLQRVRKLYDAWFLHYVKPFLQLLQHIRQFLQILRLLHINVGIELDRILSTIESRITSTFLQFRSLLNNSIDLLNILADPTLLFRKPTLVISIRRTIPAIIRAATGLPPGFFLPSPRGAAGGAFAPVPANFNPRDPRMNPPASFYLSGDDGLAGFGGFALASVPDNSAVDDLDSLDFFDDALWPPADCSDPATCIAQTVRRLAFA